MYSKSALRAKIRAMINELDEAYIKSSDEGIMRNVLSMQEFRSAGVVFAYCSVGRECATRGIIENAAKQGKTVALPRSAPQGVMDFADSSNGLHRARFGIPEPDAGLPALEPGAGDVMIVPALCCDAEGRRLGQGGGYYDRYLERYPRTVTVCICRERLLQEKVPTEWNDKPVAFVITEKRIIKTGPVSGPVGD